MPLPLSRWRFLGRRPGQGVKTNSASAAKLRLEGYVDLASPNRIEGWIVAHGKPMERRRVEIVVDGRTIAECKAGEFRGDLESAGLGVGDGCYAFFYKVRRAFEPGDHVIQILDAETGYELRGSPRTVTIPEAGTTALGLGANPDEEPSEDPYKVYERWQQYVSATTGVAESAGLVMILKQLARILDFDAICEIYDAMEHKVPLSTADGDVTGAATLIHVVANANVRCGRLERALALCERGMELFPESLPIRSTFASILRYSDPQRAYDMLAECRDLPGFTQNVESVQMMVDVAAQLRSSAFARAQLLGCFSRNNPELLLQCANLEAGADDKIHAIAEYFRSRDLAPVSLPVASGSFLDMLQGEASHQVADGPLVSVIMTCYNAERHVGSAVMSILNQTYRNLELFIVDDASSDDSLALARELAARDQRITVLASEENAGTYVAKNRALAQARGTFVTFQDSDDWAHPQKLEQQVNHLLSQPECVANWSQWVRVDDRGQFLLQSWGRYAYQNPASLMFRREPVVSSIGFFDAVRTGADTEFRQRIACRFGCATVEEVPQVLTLGRVHASSLMMNGPAAVDAYGFSAVRRQYTNSWLDWHYDNLGSSTGLYIAERQPRRKFDAPGSILPRPTECRLPSQSSALRRLGEVGRLAAIE